MPDTDRLYALSSTYTNPWWPGESGPSLLIHDPVLATRWYLTHEREQNRSVAAQVSTDGGKTWQPLPAHALMADAENVLATAAQAPAEATRRLTALVQDAMAAEAAEWLDHRIRFVPLTNHTGMDRPQTPAIASWQRGGQIWALALGTVPSDTVLTQLAAQYTAPQPEGPDKLRAAAQEILDALALVQAPEEAEIPSLLEAFRRLARLTSGPETGQLQGRAETAAHRILDHLATRLPETAAAAAARPDPQHPVHQAVRTYLQHLAHIGRLPGADQDLMADAREALTEALAEGDTTPTAALAPQPRPALPGYPKILTDLEAAAAWRLISPTGHQEAAESMEQLVQMSVTLTEVTSKHGQPPPYFQHWHTACQKHLNELNSRHALLMHATVLAEAEVAADAAKQMAARIATEPPLLPDPGGRPRTAEAIQEAYMEEVNAVDQALNEQRQLTRDAMHHLFPHAVGTSGLHLLREKLIHNSGLDSGTYERALQAVGDAQRELGARQSRLNSGYRESGSVPMTTEHVEHARTEFHNVKRRHDDLLVSLLVGTRAMKALERVVDLPPSKPDGIAARTARIAAQICQRSRAPAAIAPRADALATEQQYRHAQHSATPHIGPSIGSA
ncbi:hypothetical protein [Streptomyces botrytidirepellens]|uniref:Uncharacterized protein n=1 Tax=Streptomyces botrytidirepellens TaxID=2486417 RepID=A0A3M8X6Y6_9ACTN|nr:hypothetical protein [Streptomyces botrytidirepellens]RNG38006.1 hypothetical protein EEJ42_02170 [Streptomyces botrytidirepellens]